MIHEPVRTDPEVAAATFADHLQKFFASGRGAGPGWGRKDLDELTTVVRIPARRPDGTEDFYFVELRADYYPTWPPMTSFVTPTEEGWELARDGSRWWPLQSNSPGFPFGLHATYGFSDGRQAPLICFSHTFEFYVSDHNPTDDERWDPTRHTLSATLNRIAKVLQAPNYLEPSG